MNLSHKLDTLQQMRLQFEDHPNKAYLIDLLAEHAEEEEMTAAFLEWAAAVLKG